MIRRERAVRREGRETELGADQAGSGLGPPVFPTLACLIPKQPIRTARQAAAWLGLLAAIISARNLLEGFLEIHKALIPVSAFYANSLFFVAIVLGALILLRGLVGLPVAWLLKPVVIGCSIILIVPLIDYGLSGGRGYFLAYPIAPPGRVLATFPTIMAGIPGVSPGVRIEVALLMAGTFLYCALVLRLPWWKSALIAVGIYTIIFAISAYPSVIAYLSQPRGESLRGGMYRLPPFTPPMETRLVLLCGLEATVLGAIDRRAALRAFLSWISVSRLLFYGLMPLYGILLAYRLAPQLTHNVRSITFTVYDVPNLPVDELAVRFVLILASVASTTCSRKS